MSLFEVSDILLVEVVVCFTILNLWRRWNLVHQWPLVVVQQFILFMLKFRTECSYWLYPILCQSVFCEISSMYILTECLFLPAAH